MAVRMSSLPKFHFPSQASLMSPGYESSFSATILDSPDQRLPRSSSRMLRHQKSNLGLSMDCLSDTLQLNLSPIRFDLEGPSTKDVCTDKSVADDEGSASASASVQLSSSKLDTTYTEMVVKALVQKRAIQSACKRRLLDRLGEESSPKREPVMKTPQNYEPNFKTPLQTNSEKIAKASAAKTPAVETQSEKMVTRARLRPRARMASIRRCRPTTAMDSIVAATTSKIRQLREKCKLNLVGAGDTSEVVTQPKIEETTLDLTSRDSNTWSAKRRRISLDAEEVLESTRISQIAIPASAPTSTTPPRISTNNSAGSYTSCNRDLEDSFELASVDSIPMLELSEKLSPWESGSSGGSASQQTQNKFYQVYKGQLQLSIYMNSGLLTVHVIQAEELSSRCQTACDSYVKLSIVPDELHKSRSKTETICGSNNPCYDEKFSFELLPEDFNKRLLISVWNREQKTRRCELLGCMSFGLQGIKAKKNISQGWYYLLSEAIGRSRHLQAAAKKSPKQTPTSTMPSKPSDPNQVEPYTFSMRKGRTGYGFSVTGSHPAQVSRVDLEGPAHRSGLEPGDWIIRINGENVSTASADCVGRIIRHYQKHIVIEVVRHRQVSSRASSQSVTPALSRQPSRRSQPWQPNCSLMDSSDSSTGSSLGETTTDFTVEQWEYLKENKTSAIRRKSSIPPAGKSGGKRKRVKFSEYLNFR